MLKKVIIGRFGRVYGVRGWLRVNSFTDPTTNIFDYSPWQIQRQGEWQPIKLEAKKILGTGLIVKLAGLSDCDQARLFTNLDIAVEANILPQLKFGDYYWEQLIGLAVQTKTGVSLGSIDHLIETGANDVMVVKNGRERLLPYTADTVLSIDLEKQLITVDWDPDF